MSPLLSCRNGKELGMKVSIVQHDEDNDPDTAQWHVSWIDEEGVKRKKYCGKGGEGEREAKGFKLRLLAPSKKKITVYRNVIALLVLTLVVVLAYFTWQNMQAMWKASEKAEKAKEKAGKL
jgi:hypothetical protein